MKNLNEKAWYRFLKVLFWFIFLIFISSSIFIAVDESKTSWIKCNSGDQFQNPYRNYNYLDRGEKINISSKCNPILKSLINAGQYGNSESNILNSLEDRYGVDLNFKLFNKINTKELIIYIWLSILINVFLFWLIARIFKYIFIGENVFKGMINDYKRIQKNIKNILK